MLFLLADENLDNDIIAGLLRRNPDCKIVRVQDVGLHRATDPIILEWAASYGCILVTHDRHTIPMFAYERLKDWKPMAGVFVISKSMAIAEVIAELLLLATCSDNEEWSGRVIFLPLR